MDTSDAMDAYREYVKLQREGEWELAEDLYRDYKEEIKAGTKLFYLQNQPDSVEKQAVVAQGRELWHCAVCDCWLRCSSKPNHLKTKKHVSAAALLTEELDELYDL